MFLTLNLRKLRLPTAVCLLFVLLTAIIINRYVPRGAETWLRSAQERVLIIDAGHGGLDGGAVAHDGVTESSINLSIALRLEAAAKLFGIDTVMTRSHENLDYPEAAESVKAKKSWDQKTRVELINSVSNGVLISIHQNRYPDPGPRGAQVLYAKTAGSEAFAKAMHALINASLCPENRRVASPISENIYLMRNVSCPAVLIECGFLSNPEESLLLESDGYQKKLAITILSSFLQFSI